jgi:hypothetical protein
MAENDSVAYYYTDLISTIGSPGPTIFSRGLIEMSKRFEQNQETIEWLAIINLYYPLLIQEFEK